MEFVSGIGHDLDWHHWLPHGHPHLPEWHVKAEGFEVAVLHGGLVLVNLIWSVRVRRLLQQLTCSLPNLALQSLHILMSYPLRKGASAVVLSFLREVVGFLALVCLALRLDRGGARPPLTRLHVGLFALSGLMTALIRITIMSALEQAGPCVTAAIVPTTPVITTVAALASGMETLHTHAVSGEMIIGGMILCSLSAMAMGIFKGPLLFGAPPSGSHAPRDIPLGALTMLFNCTISSLVQLVNKKALAIYPLMSCTAFTELFAVLWLALFAAAGAPRDAWWIDRSVVAAVLFGGLLATALNNVLIARANRRLGPVVANLYVPCQPLFTAVLDFIFLGDAFYLSNILCGLGVVCGLGMVKAGRIRQLQELGPAPEKEPGGVRRSQEKEAEMCDASVGMESAPSEGDGEESETRGLLAAAAQEQLTRRLSGPAFSVGGGPPALERDAGALSPRG